MIDHVTVAVLATSVRRSRRSFCQGIAAGVLLASSVPDCPWPAPDFEGLRLGIEAALPAQHVCEPRQVVWSY
jgi:hypothetical protein